jgi:hypothetical protein
MDTVKINPPEDRITVSCACKEREEGGRGGERGSGEGE